MGDCLPEEKLRPDHGGLPVPFGSRGRPQGNAPADTAQPSVAVKPHAAPEVPEASEPMGANLEPILREACAGRLSAVSWFRTDWQRGGALTGYADYTAGDGAAHRAVVKLPVPPGERLWLKRLQPYRDIVPQLHADGEALNGYDMAWLVMERCDFGPLGQAWDGGEFDLLVEAAGRFYLAARDFHADAPTAPRDWDKILDQSRGHIHKHDLAHEQRWKTALKKAHRRLKEWSKTWSDRPTDGWCHGDLHPGNAMTRSGPPAGPAVLLDFALTHAGHWIEDAVYFEHLFWARRQRLGGRKLCSQIAHERKKLGLKVESDWPRLASTRRALVAMSTPAFLQLDGDPHHVQACLEVLEAEV